MEGGTTRLDLSENEYASTISAFETRYLSLFEMCPQVFLVLRRFDEIRPTGAKLRIVDTAVLQF